MKKVIVLFVVFAFPAFVAFYATNGDASMQLQQLFCGFLAMSLLAFGISMLVEKKLLCVLLAAVSCGAQLVGWLDAMCFYMLHKSFDFVFMFHLDANTFKFMTSTQIAGMIVIALSLVGCAWMFYAIYLAAGEEGKTTSKYLKWMMIALGMFGVVIFETPCKDLVHYFQRAHARSGMSQLTDEQMLELGIKTCQVDYETLKTVKGKNLVFVYLESFEAAFLDEKLFPGLCPNINALRKEAVVFDNITPSFHGTYSFGGIYASMAGSQIVTAQMPSVFECNTGVKSSYGGKLLTVPAILSKAGYYQVFVHGGDPAFSGLGNFLKHEHCDEYIRPQTGRGMGCRDDEMFEAAYVKYAKLAASGRPFSITMFTLDTHIGNVIEPNWEEYNTKDVPEFAGRPDSVLSTCKHTDAAFGQFIAKLKASPAWSNTVVFVMNDHFCWPGDHSRVLEKSGHRVMNMFAINAGTPRIVKTRGKTFDVAPTVLELVGVSHDYVFPVGESLLGTPNPKRLEDDTIIREECLNAYLLKKSEK